MDVFTANIDKIQLAFIFLGSFFISRLLITTKIPERFVFYLIGKKHLSIVYIVFYIIFASAFLSFFIPNVITVLTLLPVIKILCKIFEDALPHKYRAIETVFPLAIIYGANIGGMGSITGTPANGILVLYATLYAVPGREWLSFEFWLLWGVPLVIMFILAAWAVLSVSFRLWNYNNDLVQITFRKEEAFHPLRRPAITLTIVYFGLFILLSILMKTSSQKEIILAVTAISIGVLIMLLFFIPIRFSHNKPAQRFLTLQDCYSNLPWRGLFVVGIIIVLMVIGALLNLQDTIVGMLGRFVDENISLSFFYPIIAALTSFSTELLSNTVVQVAMFAVINPLFDATTFITLQAFLIITLSCTNAFMSPIATGVNGLAFGEMQGISFTKMLGAGLIMKLAGIAIISAWVPFILGWLL
jgi:sodium-dependent dicarboxylate transporter 2/3/5